MFVCLFVCIGLDEGTEKSLNGPRVTSMIYKLVGEKTFPNFLIVLRCIRKWAKRRGDDDDDDDDDRVMMMILMIMIIV